jgi:hypothetical protein
MASVNRPARLNRTLLALTGLVLVAGGGFAVATHFGWLRVLDPGTELIPAPGSPPTWAFYAAAAVAVIVGLLALRWLAAQAVRRPKTSVWRFGDDDGSTRLDAGTAIRPLTEEIGAYQGVHAATATLGGPQDDPALYLAITAEPGADLGEIRRRVDEHALARLRESLDLETLPTTIEFQFTAKSGARAL